ncbi:hypothetical protein M0R45_003073 [Rubus argutus]|uniref:Methyltransferase type 11 domain-containing protein n=1 Tax=Rubus argutus TaxID=59490 RepID=A0AAW1YFB8_RUBAR
MKEAGVSILNDMAFQVLMKSLLKRGPTTLLASDIVLVRADVSRLPFTSCSVDAVHAGAALHCWPSPSKGVAEITRILRNGTWHLCWNHFSAVYSLILLPGCSSHSLRGFFPAGTISGRKRSRTCVHHAVSPTTRSKVEQSFIIFSAQKP